MDIEKLIIIVLIYLVLFAVFFIIVLSKIGKPTIYALCPFADGRYIHYNKDKNTLTMLQYIDKENTTYKYISYSLNDDVIFKIAETASIIKTTALDSPIICLPNLDEVQVFIAEKENS